MKKIGSCLSLGIILTTLSCTRDIKPYKFHTFDAALNSVVIIVDTPISEQQFLQTAMYVLDSTNHKMKLNKHEKMGIYIFADQNAADALDTTKMVGKYVYYFDTKEQIIEFKK